MAYPKVEFLWWSGCPSWRRALDDLRAAMADAGLDPEAVVLEEIEDEAGAARAGFSGSPTIRVGGADVAPGAAPEGSRLNCRAYRRRDGRVSPLPDPEDVRAALVAAREAAGLPA